MARTQKTAQAPLTLEQIPAIPVEEQPYPLPKGWKWVRLGDVANIIMGQSPAGNDTTNNNSYTPLIGGASDIGLLYPAVTKYTKKPTKLSQPDDIIICIRATLGHPIFSDGVYCLGRGVAAIRSAILNVYFTRFIFINFEHYLYKYATGSTFLQINSIILNRMSIPLPPIDEQQRIVERIESLFAKLDEAKEKSESVVESFEKRKAAILNMVFSGKQTKKWDIVKLKDISTLQTGIMKCKKKYKNTILKPYLRVANVQDGFFNLNEIKNIEVDMKKVERWTLKKGDVLFTEGGDFDKLGRGAVWEDQIHNCLHQNHIFSIRVNRNILNPYFLSYQTRSKYGKSYFLKCSKQTTNLASINSTQLKNFPVLLPSLPEQQEIVRILDELLAREERIKETAEKTLERIDLMKKAILAKAFRGELRTNVHSDNNQ